MQAGRSTLQTFLLSNMHNDQKPLIDEDAFIVVPDSPMLVTSKPAIKTSPYTMRRTGRQTYVLSDDEDDGTSGPSSYSHASDETFHLPTLVSPDQDRTVTSSPDMEIDELTSDIENLSDDSDDYPQPTTPPRQKVFTHSGLPTPSTLR